MNLENRVEQLEHELKILKNEIQQTLLDIQEQVLIHYYPTLRAAEDQDAEEARPSQPNLSMRQKKKEPHKNGVAKLETVEILPLDQIMFDEEDSIFIDAPPAMNGRRNGAPAGQDDREQDAPYDATDGEPVRRSPHTREISLRDIRHREPAPRVHTNGHQPAARKQFTQLAEWVEESVRTVGKERTRLAVEAYAGGGYVSDDIGTLLARLIDLSEEPAEVDTLTGGGTFELLTKLDQILGDTE